MKKKVLTITDQNQGFFYFESGSNMARNRLLAVSFLLFLLERKKESNTSTRSWACERKGRDTRCDKSLGHVAATSCCNKSPRVTICSTNSNWFEFVRHIAASDKISAHRASVLSQRLVAASAQTRRCVPAICHIVCLGLNMQRREPQVASFVFRRSRYSRFACHAWTFTCF